MAITKIPISDFLQLYKNNIVLDVRSPSEYAQAHIPNAKSFPLFSDEERKIVGTAYKQQSKEIAIKIGLDFFGPKMRSFVESVETMLAKNNYRNETNNQLPITNCILVHCWRGGMRSAAVAWLLDLYGFKVYTLVGGYKAYRNWVLQQFNLPYTFKIIGGYTGSGKTLLLNQLAKQGNSIIDLEALANHKGSALGGIGQVAQPSQEMFENLLVKELTTAQQITETQPQELHNATPKLNKPIVNCSLPTAHCIWLEDESQRIGNLQIPMPLWITMRSSKLYFFNIPFQKRLNYLVEEYGTLKKNELVTAIMRIQKKLGGLETKNAINFLLENNFQESFKILLQYYDKHYLKGLYNRENAKILINTIESQELDAKKNIELLKGIFKN
ncbi:MAG: tRNA 2-selenouridine(34) synthase MnmH [Ferruginibacter sp.]|nr:tRNA 2-selenouridine(34) synthase MnmH [Ferruginibacter sp.]